MPRGVRQMSEAESELRKLVRAFLKKGGRSYAQAKAVKDALDEVLDEAKRDAIAAFQPPQGEEDDFESDRQDGRRRAA